MRNCGCTHCWPCLLGQAWWLKARKLGKLGHSELTPPWHLLRCKSSSWGQASPSPSHILAVQWRIHYQYRSLISLLRPLQGAEIKEDQDVSDTSDTHQVGLGTLGNGSTGLHNTGLETSERVSLEGRHVLWGGDNSP